MNIDLADRLLQEGFAPFEIKDLNKESILQDEVFHHIFSFDNQLQRTTVIVKLQAKAKELGVLRMFDKMLNSHQLENAQKYLQDGSNVIQFTNPPIPNLKCGKWECIDAGISKTILITGNPQKVTACTHPIMPIERLKNVDTDIEKVKLAFFKDGIWHNITVERSMVANKSNIINLADRGIEVNSQNSRELVSYIADVVSLNMLEIPVYRSIGRIGWIDGEFAPYIKDIKYDGDSAYKDLYESIKEYGDFERWRKLCVDLRSYNKVTHLLLAASFASPLNAILNTLPFVVHIWGGTGTGKTVGLMLAMSVWGNPELGKLVRSLNCTQVALGRMASFLHDIPFAGDEFQIIKNRWDNTDNLIMFLTEGLDRGRGKAYGGLEEMHEWKSCFIFTGEEPIVKSNSGGGVKNRVIEIYTEDKVVEDGNYVSGILRENYGFAGKMFVNGLNKDTLKTRYREIFKEILDTCDTTEKQAMAMAVVLLADEIATGIIFRDGNALTIHDVKEFMSTTADVDVAQRAYDWIINWISANQNRFKKEDNNGEVWGKLEELTCIVNKNILVEHLHKNGFDFSAVVSKMGERGQLERNSQGKYTHQTKVHGIKGNYVKLIITDILDLEEYQEVPF